MVMREEMLESEESSVRIVVIREEMLESEESSVRIVVIREDMLESKARLTPKKYSRFRP